MTHFSILIDNRELKLKNYFKEYNYVEFKNLDIGDIIFKIEDQIVLIIERKTINDLYCSIKDGRYKEQKTRLISNYSTNNILYLLEETIVSYKHKFNTDIIYGTVINTLIRDNIRILHSISIQETIKYIEILIKRLETNKEFFITDTTNTLSTPIDYSETIKLEKKKNLTPDICQITQLAQIPGVSIHSAKIILEQYGNKLKNLILAYDKLEDIHEKEMLLATIEVKSLKNDTKSKKIGQIISKRIFDFLN